jgi:tetratricopeptide (TPR) repeat protein
MKYFYRFSIILISTVTVFISSGIATASTIEEINQIAEEITVLIPEKFVGGDGQTKEANGSGSIIAKQGNIYTVLTASHVICRDPEGECKDYRDFKVIAHDGNEYKVNTSTIQRLPGVDLAVFQFNSDRNYRLAILGNYEPTGEQFVFASGWPDPKFVGKRERFFNVGKVLPQSMMPLLKIFPPSLGYEMVYTSVTYGGMSGGPVLDTNGQVVAVHGQNEGERIAGVRVAIGFSVAIPISTFVRLIPQIGIKENLKINNSSPPPLVSQQIIEIGKEFYQELELLDFNNTNPLDWLNQGNKMWRLGQLATASAAYDKALKLDPNLYQAWYGKGLVLTYWQKKEEAIAAYDQALKIKPDSEIAKKLRDKLKESLGSAKPVFNQPNQTESPIPEPLTPVNSNPSLW